MKLKEAFRYQQKLKCLMAVAGATIQRQENCLTTHKLHKIKEVNPDAEDKDETVERNYTYYPNDEIIQFMLRLIDEREELTKAIDVAKSEAPFDVDAAIETNKFRQSASKAIKGMLSTRGSKRTEIGRTYRVNADGNQAPYVYDIEVENSEAFNREASRATERMLDEMSDGTSSEIDSFMINTDVHYEPLFDVNDTFEDAMQEFERMQKGFAFCSKQP